MAFTLSQRPVIRAADGARGGERGTPAPSPRRMAGPYRAEAIRVVDGDTFEARLRIWFNQEVTVLIRLEGVDAPEMKGRCPQERRLAQDARDALTAILTSGAVTVRDLHADKYNGRAVARALVTDGSGFDGDDVGDLLLAGGYARAYDGRARLPWCGAAPALLADGKRAR
ncbi:MAG: thermonuclease family protein [Beijerinckiaceae bacterium]|nr:thermonuclease family protein [Beijerinckiaceae bacterium]